MILRLFVHAMRLAPLALSLCTSILWSCASDPAAQTTPPNVAQPDAATDGGRRESGDAMVIALPGDGGGVESPADLCPEKPVVLGSAVTNARGANTPAITHASYDYAPSVMHDGRYRMWWCGGVAGDHILYAEADKLDGPWHSRALMTPSSFDDVFQPTRIVGDFDGAHTCDPSVLRVNARYYMYYGGLGEEGTPNNTTRIGLATSEDGFTWTRTNGGKPIIDLAQSLSGKPNQYGTGQPSAFYKDGFFYVSFTDTSAAGSNPVNGAGQYVLRSKDPSFQTGAEELGKTGFQALAPKSLRPHSFTEAFSPDLTYVPAINMFMMATHGTPGLEELRFFNADFSFSKLLTLPFAWAEGPGIVKRPDGQLDPTPACDTLRVDLMRAVGTGDVNTWELAHSGGDVATGRTCDCVSWPRVLEGSLLVSPGKPLTIVRGGTRLQFAQAAPATRLARTAIEVPDALYGKVPYGASMGAMAPAVGATGKPAAFKLDNDTLWPASCLEVFTDNGSSLQPIASTTYDALPKGPSLFCLK
jgi:hypothetical protein